MAEAAPTLPPDPLDALVDIPLPLPVSLWPQTWPSRIALVLVIVGLVVATWWLARWWWVNRYRRAALAELVAIERTLEKGPPFGAAAATLALLVRRTALAAFPRAEVAALSGPDWLGFLDRSYGGDEFTRGVGRVLAVAPYQPSRVGMGEVMPLTALVRRWIRTHHD